MFVRENLAVPLSKERFMSAETLFLLSSSPRIHALDFVASNARFQTAPSITGISGK